jgi:hypothetical protein
MLARSSTACEEGQSPPSARFPLGPPRGGEFKYVAVVAQLRTLMRNYPEVGARLSSAQQGESSLPILLVVPQRIGLVYLSLNDAGGAADAPTLLAHAREIQPPSASGVEDILLGAYLNWLDSPVGEFYLDSKALSSDVSGSLGGVETGILAVWSVARIASAEVPRGPAHAITLHAKELDEPRLVLNLLVEDARGHVVGARVLPKG